MNIDESFLQRDQVSKTVEIEISLIKIAIRINFSF